MMSCFLAASVFLSILITSQQQGCDTDVFFIVDSSNVITDNARTGDRLQHWYSIRTTMANVMQRLNNSRISVSIYADTARQVVAYPTSGQQAANVMTSLDFLGGPFSVGSSITWVRENVIGPNKRQSVTTTCVLLATFPPFGTDLNVWNTEKDLLRNVCSKLIILTIGRIDLETSYRSVATTPADFLRVDFTSLAGNVAIETFILTQISTGCPTVPTTTTSATTTTTLKPPQGCLNQVDVVYMLDASTNTDSANFEPMKNFVANQILDLDIENGRVHVGILSFADDVIVDQRFSNISSRSVARDFVLKLIRVGGKSNLTSAFARVRQGFLTDAGRRTNIPFVVVLLTNGIADDPRLAISESRLLRNAGASILVVSAGSYNNLNVINSITSFPHETNYFNSLNDLQSLSPAVLSSLCDNVNECQSNPCQRGGQCVQRYNNYFCYCPTGYAGKNCELDYCKDSRNVFFALTAASSITFQSMVKQVDLVRNLITNINLRDSKVGVGTFYNTSLEVRMNFQTYDSLKSDVITFQQRLYDSISSFHRGGYTNLSMVINVVRTTVFPDGGNNVLVLFVSGPSSDYRASALEASLARTGVKSIQIIVVTVGQMYSSNEINGIASSIIGNGVTREDGLGFELSPNIVPIDDFVPGDSNIINRLTRFFCNYENECVSNPCQNQGTCTDLINGYMCVCTNLRTGLNCERDGTGQLDIVIGFDTSGSIRHERFYNFVINFVVRIVSRLEISPSKTRVGAVKWSRSVTDLFHLDTYTTAQDVVWGLQQVTYDTGGGGTNTAAALRLIRDVLLSAGQNGERPSAKNIVLLFTDGNSNIEELDTIPTAVDLRIKREAYVITFGIGSDANPYELIGLSSYPVVQDQSYFLVDSAASANSKFTAYLQALLNTQQRCSNSPCQNNGVCIEDRKQFICRCIGNYGGTTCDKACQRGNDVAILLDISGSGNRQQVYNTNLQIARAIATTLPFNNTKFSLITFGDSANVRFNFNNFTRPQDLFEAFSFRLSSGVQSLRNALSYLYGQSSINSPKIFVSESGDRPSNPNIAVIITNSDSPGSTQDIIQEADSVKRSLVSIYAIVVGDGPDGSLFNSLVSNQTNLLRINSENEINNVVESLKTLLCN